MKPSVPGRRAATTGKARSVVMLACLFLVTASCSGSPKARSAYTPVIVAAGDIACGEAPTPADPQHRCRYDLVGQLVSSLAPDRFLAVGDIQHTLGGPPDYTAFYDRYFGGLKAVTEPTPGEVDWMPNPDAYFSYFGAAAGPPNGYYSFDLGSWHIISLNSADCFDADGCDAGSPQVGWLRADLATHPNDLYPCTLAFFHDPRFLWVQWWQRNGKPKGPESHVTSLWSFLYQAGVDVVINGNAHNYERWAPQNLDGKRDPKYGMTEFVVGTGGKRLIPFGPEPRPRQLVAAQDDAYGALRMALGANELSYSWRSAPEQPFFRDDGTVRCH